MQANPKIFYELHRARYVYALEINPNRSLLNAPFSELTDMLEADQNIIMAQLACVYKNLVVIEEGFDDNPELSLGLVVDYLRNKHVIKLDQPCYLVWPYVVGDKDIPSTGVELYPMNSTRTSSAFRTEEGSTLIKDYSRNERDIVDTELNCLYLDLETFQGGAGSNSADVIKSLKNRVNVLAQIIGVKLYHAD